MRHEDYGEAEHIEAVEGCRYGYESGNRPSNRDPDHLLVFGQEHWRTKMRRYCLDKSDQIRISWAAAIGYRRPGGWFDWSVRIEVALLEHTDKLDPGCYIAWLEQRPNPTKPCRICLTKSNQVI